MTGDIGFIKPVDKIICWGQPPITVEREVESATNMYPGRLVKKGTTDNEIVVATPATAMVLGWLGYEYTSVAYREATVDTIYTVNSRAAIHMGGGFGIVGSLTPKVAVELGDLLAPWTDGELIPIEMTEFGWAIKIPFTKNATLTDTGIDIPQYMIIKGANIRVTTAVGSATIDVGLGAGSESGYDADGLIDGLSCADIGKGVHVTADTTAGNVTVGALLRHQIKSADGTAVFPIIMEPFKCDGTCVSVDYTTSAHDIAGYILVAVDGPGFFPVARAMEVKAANSSSQDIMVQSLI